jgi:hypothetical protein
MSGLMTAYIQREIKNWSGSGYLETTSPKIENRIENQMPSYSFVFAPPHRAPILLADG